MKYYLAYGSNLNKRQMKKRCPDAVPVGSCVVSDYELLFRAYATIEPKPGASVQCGIWKISAEDEKHLDVYEGYPSLYVKQDFRVKVKGKTVTAMAYVMANGVRPLSPPSTGYLMTIMEGYHDFDLNDKPLTIAAAQEG